MHARTRMSVCVCVRVYARALVCGVCEWVEEEEEEAEWNQTLGLVGKENFFFKSLGGERRITAAAAELRRILTGRELQENNPISFGDYKFSVNCKQRMYFYWKKTNLPLNAGNFSTEMEGNAQWIIFSLLLCLHAGEGKFTCWIINSQHVRVCRSTGCLDMLGQMTPSVRTRPHEDEQAVNELKHISYKQTNQ